MATAESCAPPALSVAASALSSLASSLSAASGQAEERGRPTGGRAYEADEAEACEGVVTPCGANMGEGCTGVTLKPIPAFSSVGGGRLATLRAVSSNRLSAPPPLGVLSGETLFVDRGVILWQHTSPPVVSLEQPPAVVCLTELGTPPLPLVRQAKGCSARQNPLTGMPGCKARSRAPGRDTAQARLSRAWCTPS